MPPKITAAANTPYSRSSNGQNQVDTRNKIRCSIGGEWKPRCEFSNRQLQKFDTSRASPGKSGVSCKVHTAQPARELQCEGPCGLWRPLEHFSKSTRAQNKYWCIDCTTWQLSVEPGMPNCAPPNSAAEVDERAMAQANQLAITQTREAQTDRVERWIQGNPSEAGDYVGLDTSTQPSILDSASEVSEPTLLDNSIVNQEGLPQALNAMNLSRIGRYDEPSTAVQANNTRSRPGGMANMPSVLDTHSQDSDSKTTIIGDNFTETEQRTYCDTSHSTEPSVTGALGTVALVGTGVTMVHALPIRQRSPGPSGWARPDRRKVPWAPPKYVLNGSGADFYQYYQLQEADDEGPSHEPK